MESEGIGALDFTERRHVKRLAALKRLAVGKWPSVLMRQQIVVPLTESIADLAQYGANGTVAVVADPEAHRIEDVSQHSGKGVKDNLAFSNDGFGSQQRADPRFQRAAIACAVIAIEKTHQRPTIVRKPQPRQVAEPRQGKRERKRVVSELVADRPQAAMHDHAMHKLRNGLIHGTLRSLCGCALAHDGRESRCDAFGDYVRRGKPVLMKPVTHPGPCVPRALLALQVREPLLRSLR